MFNRELSLSESKKPEAYGEHRTFVGLESFIIYRRLKEAHKVLEKVTYVNKTPQVLELGCGYYGSNLKHLSRRFPEAQFLGVDITVNKDVNDERIKLVSADLASWRPDNKFDCVLSLAVAEHLTDLPCHFRLIHDALANDGIAVITTPKPQAHFVLDLMAALRIFDRDSIRDHKIYLTRLGIKKLAEESQLKLLDYRSILVLNQVCTMSKIENS